MATDEQLTAEVRELALAAGADLVGVASIDRFDSAPADVHPRSVFSKTRSVIALGCRMVRGALKTIEEGNFWQAYNCDSYQYLNEVLAPHMLRKIVMFLEDRGYTSVPFHNPFCSGVGRPVREGGTRPAGIISLRMVGCAAGLGELGLCKVFLTPKCGPRQRMFAVLTDAELAPDPLLEEHVCDNCGSCIKGCPAGAIPRERTIEWQIGERTFSHADVDFGKCVHFHQGWDPRYSPFVDAESSRENPPAYFRFLERRFRHHSICGARGCVRACMDHLEKTGKIEKQYRTPMIEGAQWVMDDLPA